MSAQCGKLVSLVLYEHFGEVVEKVGYHLFKYGVSPLWLIVKYTELPISKVKLALCVLVKYGLVNFEPGKNDAYAEYNLLADNVLLILRYPKFGCHIKKLFGEESEIMLEETLIRGYAIASDLITLGVNRMKKNHNKDASSVDIKDKFISLVTAKYLKRYPEKGVVDNDRFRVPTINIGQLSSNPGDSEVYWCANFDRFHQDMRDTLLVNAVTRRFDENAGELMKILLQQMYIRTEPWAETSNPIPFVEIKDVIRNHNKDASSVDIKDKFISLVTAKYLKRYPEKGVVDNDRFRVPTINIGQLSSNPGDSEVYWCANFDRFHQDMRDTLLVNAVTRRFDENAGELMKILLQQMYIRTEPWAETSNPIPFVEIKDVIRKTDKNSKILVYLEHYLTVLADDASRFITKVGDASGGQYVINLKNAVSELTWATLENVVLEKFDTKAARIFRLVRAKKFIEPEQIQQLAMIPSKETKRLSYQLLEENFLQLQELRKASTTSSGPNKSFVLFHIDLEQIVRMVLELCLKTLYNAITRRHHDKLTNKRVIDKKHRVDTITMSLKVQGAPEDQLEDIADMITPPEKEMLERIGKIMKRLNLAELEVDDSIHLLQLYLKYHS